MKIKVYEIKIEAQTFESMNLKILGPLILGEDGKFNKAQI